MKIEINEDGTVTIDGEIYKKVEKVVNVPLEPLHPTIDEIYDSVKPKFKYMIDGKIYTSNQIFKDSLPTQEDAEYILATTQLINIAAYYNAKYPSGLKKFTMYPANDKVYYDIVIQFVGQILFTESAAKEALSNPNVVEVLNKYFKIK